VNRPTELPRLLAAAGVPGRPLGLEEHTRRLGRLSLDGGDRGLIDSVSRSGLRGRGGGAFPTGRKMHTVAAARRRPVVVVNGAEGEPVSAKDAVLLAAAPHLVLDGAVAAAAAVDADEVMVAVRRGANLARQVVELAVRERRQAATDPVGISVHDVPDRYVAGEETALVRWLDGGPAKPTFTPPRPFERGVGGRPTLMQNVETLAHVALIARFGAEWFRSVGAADDPGTVLVTITGCVQRPAVYELPTGADVADAMAKAGGATGLAQAFLIGGFFGGWVAARDVHRARLVHDPADGTPPLGCGAIVALPESACGLKETARIVRYLAGESAGQCGPCALGVPAIATAMEGVAYGRDDPRGNHLRRWSAQVRGRGACGHPDAVARVVHTALEVFEDEILAHASGRCSAANGDPVVRLPRPSITQEWR
jgi:NADH:ubiquinone oxidoreductase subunit F (NADH-binding)